ncbi:hypothetical protein [Streptomyces europaeiscabiei]|uniref:hypothetical protein n=1 Tax=Streptomyces europaeiscabiei TaxID=146819 RepID=UPI0029AA908D|nr:hypothetical protein [Streptomyces europaeiscabiei]MDX3585978.1 hypothetical protein [Streptomyces europaeiscabiei]
MTHSPVELALCPDCSGLEVTALTKLEGVRGFTITLDDGTPIASGTEVYAWPTRQPCPNQQAEGG